MKMQKNYFGCDDVIWPIFKAEIFAAEPYVIDPVSMEFDEQGNACCGRNAERERHKLSTFGFV